MRLILTAFVALVLAAPAAGQWQCVDYRCVDGVCRPVITTAPGWVCKISNKLGRVSCEGGGALFRCDEKYGYVVTCGHLFSDGVGEVVVTYSNGERWIAKVISRQSNPDLALLKTYRPKIEPIRRIARGVARGIRIVAHLFRGGQYFARPGHVIGIQGGHLVVSGAAVSGDSGAAIVGPDGGLVGVIWGSDGASTYAATPDQIRDFVDVALSPQTPPAEHVDPTPSTDSLLAEIARLRKRVEELEKRPPVPGPAGPRGPPGEPAALADLPPIDVKLYDPDGNIIDETAVSLGGTLRLQLYEREVK